MTEKTEERIPAAEPGVDRFALLAGAVAGRKVAVAPADAPRSYTDGERIFVSADEVGHPRDTLVVQAALLAVGSLDPKLVARTTGRKALRHRYLTLEAARALGELQAEIPRGTSRRIESLYSGPLPGSPEESLRLAGSDEVPEAPEWLGTIRPTTLLRNSTAVGGAPTEKDRKGQSKQVDMPELDEDEDSSAARSWSCSPRRRSRTRSPATSRSCSGWGPVPTRRAAAARSCRWVASAPGASAGTRSRWRRGGGPDRPGGAPDRAPVSGVGLAEAPLPPRLVRSHRVRPQAPSRGLTPARTARLRRELARLGLAHERHRRQDEGDVLDLTALIELSSTVASGGRRPAGLRAEAADGPRPWCPRPARLDGIDRRVRGGPPGLRRAADRGCPPHRLVRRARGRGRRLRLPVMGAERGQLPADQGVRGPLRPRRPASARPRSSRAGSPASAPRSGTGPIC